MTEVASPPLFVVHPAEVSPDQGEALATGAVAAPAEALVAEVTGPGAVACVQGLLTNDLEGPGDGAFVYGAVLTTKGVILCDVWAARMAGTVTLTYPPQGRAALFDVFQRYLPPRLARAADRSAELMVLRLAGPEASAVAERAGLALPPPGTTLRSPFRPSDCQVSQPPLAQPFALQLVVKQGEDSLVLAALEDAGATIAPPAALELERILCGWPRLGAEIDQKTLPQEVRYDEINGVSYTKGCYAGQETVARLHFRGHVNRGLVGLVWEETPDLEQPEIAQLGRTAGRVSSVAWLARVERYVGLGLVRRETDRSQPVEAAGAAATLVGPPIRLAS